MTDERQREMNYLADITIKPTGDGYEIAVICGALTLKGQVTAQRLIALIRGRTVAEQCKVECVPIKGPITEATLGARVKEIEAGD